MTHDGSKDFSKVRDWLSKDLEPAHIESNLRALTTARHKQIVRQRTLAATAFVLLIGGGAAGLSTYPWKSADTAEQWAASSGETRNTTQKPEVPAKEAVPVVREDVLLQNEVYSVAALRSETRVETVRENQKKIVLALTDGSARFDVEPLRKRELEVQAGPVKVRVIGTVFSVTRDEDAVAVSVEEGRVWASLGDEEVTLAEGQTRSFHLEEEIPVEPTEPTKSDEVRSSKRRRKAASSWQAKAKQGDMAGAYEELKGEELRDKVSDLLLASDVARNVRKPREAAGYLEKILARHRSDKRAPLAAFTLGRILLYKLGQPRRAAKQFRLTQTLSPRGELAEPALAKEIECWLRGKDISKGKAAAKQYLAKYPKGPHVADAKKALSGS